MERTVLYNRINHLRSTLEMTLPMVSGLLHSAQPDVALIDELISFQLDAYQQMRLLLEQYAGADCQLLEKYDLILHQLKTDYVLVTCGIHRTHAA